jgi:hypothetical protein
VGVAKVYFQQRDYTAIVMELLSTDLHNLLQANAKVGSIPDTRDALIYSIGIARGMLPMLPIFMDLGMRHLHMLGFLHSIQKL